MKKIIFLTFLLPFTLFSQKGKFNKTKSKQTTSKIQSLDSLTFNDLDKFIGSIEYKNALVINNYKTKDNSWLKVGDTLEIGKPSNINNIQKTNLFGATAANVNHSYIFLGSVASALMGTNYNANDSMTGDKVFITGIFANRISKKQPYSITVTFNKLGGGRFLGIKKIARADLEKAMSVNELINPNRGMNKQEAIAKLKEAKDLLDLEIISEEDYNKLKAELKPIITK